MLISDSIEELFEELMKHQNKGNQRVSSIFFDEVDLNEEEKGYLPERNLEDLFELGLNKYQD